MQVLVYRTAKERHCHLAFCAGSTESGVTYPGESGYYKGVRGKMSQATKDAYLKMIAELEVRRELGEASDEIESEYCGKLDDLWYAMTKDEIREVESVLGASPLAPDDLNLRDVSVQLGESKLPREAR
jgi:hypothetical protein